MTGQSFPSANFQPQLPGACQFWYPSGSITITAGHPSCPNLHHLHNHNRSHILLSVHNTVKERDNYTPPYGSHSFDSFEHPLNGRGLEHWPRDDIGSAFVHSPQSTPLHCDAYKEQIYSVPSVALLRAAPAQRSLTFNTAFLYDETMTTTPPDLSGSKSSKSSSLQSAQFDCPDGLAKDIANFEEITLDESLHHRSAEEQAWDYKKEATRSTSHASLIRARPAMPPRDLAASSSGGTNINSSSIDPGLQEQVRNASGNQILSRSVSPSRTGGVVIGRKGGSTRPSIATFPMPVPGGPQPRTRSSSPSPKLPVSASFASMGHNVRCGPKNTSTGPPNRRLSWQSVRKSSKQLEAEYHDSDDELPDDASLWNVPMSPRPPTARPSSAKSSRRSSPDRDFFSGGQRPLPFTPVLPAPASPPLRPISQPRSRNPLPPRTSSLPVGPVSATPPTSPTFRSGFRDHRAKSWTLAMAELSEEARVLTENLEIHTDNEGRRHEELVQNGIKTPRPSSESDLSRGLRSSAVELPGIQRGNILIDPMPPSKEKEAVLTRTRPSWLPPKDPKEERRHVKEYQRMVTASLDAERKKEARNRAQRCEKDDTREALNRIWEQYVYPDWDRVTHEHRVRELWWRGVSPKLRGQIWTRAVGNSLALTRRSYSMALQRIKDSRAKSVECRNERDKAMLSWVTALERDTQFTFPELNLFQRDRGLWQELVDVCGAYASYRSDVGYRYEIQLIAAIMLLQLPSPADVFILLANCLNGPLALAFLTNDATSTARILDQASFSLLYKVPRLHRYLFESAEAGGLGMDLADVFDVPLRTLLTNGLDIDRLVRVWDCFAFEGERVLVRTTIALLSCLQTQILGFEGSVPERQRQVWELLSWGPRGRVGGYWDFQGDPDSFMAEVKEAGKYNVEGE